MIKPAAAMNYLISLLILSTAMLQLVGCSTKMSQYEIKGRKYAVAGDWDNSVKMYQLALKDDPENPDIKAWLRRAKYQAANSHRARGEILLREKRFNEALSELQISYTFNPTDSRTAELLGIATNKKEADHLFKRGQNSLKSQKYDQARKLFQRALKLDPEHSEAQKALDRFRKKKDPTKRFSVDFKTNTPISFKFKKTPILNVFEVLSKLTGMNFIFDKEMKDNKVTLFMTDITFDRFLDTLLQTNKLAGKMVSDKTMIVYPDTPAKAKEYEELQIRTFYLSNLEAKQAVVLLSKILKTKNIFANDNLNSVVIRGSQDEVVIAERLIAANDGTPAEVMLNVEILQVDSSKERQLGLEISESVTLGIGETAPVISNDSELADWGSLYALGNLSSKNLLLSLPTATLNLLKQDGDTRILAKPQIRVKNGKKSSFLIGERVPIRVNRRVDSGTGDVTSDFEYQDVGIKLEAKPIINIDDEITMTLFLEISTLGPNLGTAEDPQFAILTRTARSELTVRDGETIIIGGLISDEERRTVRRIPGLGDIPAAGTLFSAYDIEAQETDILMVINPIVTRRQEIPNTELTRIWSGQDSNFSTRVPYQGSSERRNTYFLVPRNTSEQDESANDTLRKGPASQLPPQSSTAEDAGGVQTPASETPSRSQNTESTQNLSDAKLAIGDTSSKKSLNTIPSATSPSSLTSSIGGGWPASAAYSIHVNSYLKRLEAQKRKKELERKNYTCFVIPAEVTGKGFFYRVFVGGFSTYSAAVAAKNKYRLRQEFTPDIHVVDRKWAVGK